MNERIRLLAKQAGIEMSGGFAVVAECVTLDELKQFADIVISEYSNAVKENQDWEAIAGDLTMSNILLRQDNEKLKDLMALAKVQSRRKDCNDILQDALDDVYVDIDYYVTKDLLEAHERLIVPDQDESGVYLEPDYKIIEALELVLSYYMPKYKFDEWFSKVQTEKIRLWSDFNGGK